LKTLKILFLAANPLDSGRLQLEAEARDSEEGLERSAQRERMAFDCKFAVRVRDLRRSLLDSHPQVVHFSGHGDGPASTVLQDDEGESVYVETQALAYLFDVLRDSLRLLFRITSIQDHALNIPLLQLGAILRAERAR
jgi:hypothetical protein